MERERRRLRMLVGVLAMLGLAGLIAGAGIHVANAQGGMAVSIVDFAFQPPLSGIPTGATVTWTNTGSVAHTVTADISEFDSGPLAPGTSYTRTFNNEGSFTYYCQIHPGMTGTLVVTAGGEPQAFGPGSEPAVPVVGVGSMAAGRGGELALLMGCVAAALGIASLLTYRRA